MLVEELKKLSNLSENLGKNLDFIQGAGGNTSVKINETLWIKASGCWLSDANQKNIFVRESPTLSGQCDSSVSLL